MIYAIGDILTYPSHHGREAKTKINTIRITDVRANDFEAVYQCTGYRRWFTAEQQRHYNFRRVLNAAAQRTNTESAGPEPTKSCTYCGAPAATPASNTVPPWGPIGILLVQANLELDATGRHDAE